MPPTAKKSTVTGAKRRIASRPATLLARPAAAARAAKGQSPRLWKWTWDVAAEVLLRLYEKEMNVCPVSSNASATRYFQGGA